MQPSSQRLVERDDPVRAAALASSIALFLGDLDLEELLEVDAKVMEVRRRRHDADSTPIDTRLKTALVELRDSTPTIPRPLIEFDMSDLGGEG